MKKLLNFINYLLIVFVIGMLIYIIGIGPSAFEMKINSINKNSEVNSIVENVENVNINGIEDTRSDYLELTPVEKCEYEFNKYSEIGESKYEQVDFSLTLTKEINNDEEAKEFDNTYSSFLSGRLLGMDLSTFKEIEYNYPIIALLAEIRIEQDSEKSTSVPIILYCYGNGTISEQPKKMLTLSS